MIRVNLSFDGGWNCAFSMGGGGWFYDSMLIMKTIKSNLQGCPSEIAPDPETGYRKQNKKNADPKMQLSNANAQLWPHTFLCLVFLRTFKILLYLWPVTLDHARCCCRLPVRHGDQDLRSLHQHEQCHCEKPGIPYFRFISFSFFLCLYFCVSVATTDFIETRICDPFINMNSLNVRN